MTLEQFGIIIGIATGLLSLLSVIYFGTVKMTKIEVKVDTMWDFQLRRGWSELAIKGKARANSPLVLNEETKEWMGDLAQELKAFYSKLGRHLNDRELAIEIEQKYGDQILRKVCIPNGLSEGACLIIALQVAKEVNLDI
jgi:hypothetical protein